jgi:hypothetical protein
VVNPIKQGASNPSLTRRARFLKKFIVARRVSKANGLNRFINLTIHYSTRIIKSEEPLVLCLTKVNITSGKHIRIFINTPRATRVSKWETTTESTVGWLGSNRLGASGKMENTLIYDSTITN